MHGIKVKSDILNLNQVENLIDEVCTDYKINDDLYGNVLISVTEAFNNAVIHGNHKDNTKFVFLNVTKTPKNLSFEVIDEGEGFDFNNLPDPTSPENIEKLNGRGIFLMKQLSDKVEFFDNGKKVSITFALE